MRTPVSLGDVPSLRNEFEPAGGGHEFRSRDGKRLLDVQLHPQGVRDLHATFLRMAQEVARDRRVAKAILAAWMPRPTDDRIEREWKATLDLFKPSIAARLALVIVRPDRTRPLDGDKDVRRIGEILRTHLSGNEQPAREPKDAFFEIVKVLLNHRLRKRGPMAIGELMRRTGTSYPTVAEALRKLEKAQELARRSNRSVEFSRFPEKTWAGILARSETLRRSRFYADSSGRRISPLDLQRRLPPAKQLAVGGVAAARRWDPKFDLNGMPRLDIVAHFAAGVGDFGFVERLDPALKRVEAGTEGIILAVHPLRRDVADFEKNPKGKIEWADPVETLLDLHELRLADQAEAMIRHLTAP
jgi:hypothetical protein